MFVYRPSRSHSLRNGIYHVSVSECSKTKTRNLIFKMTVGLFRLFPSVLPCMPTCAAAVSYFSSACFLYATCNCLPYYCGSLSSPSVLCPSSEIPAMPLNLAHLQCITLHFRKSATLKAEERL